MLNKLSLSILAGLLVAVLCGCSAQIPSLEVANERVDIDAATPEVTVVITRDFGKEVLLKQTTGIEPSTTAMDALQMVANVETKYGGGFVSAINGVSSEYEGANRSKKDWFFYINGIASNVGARDYVLQDGDIEHWDFRNWSYHQFVPAIVGDFPHPFLNSYQRKVKPTVIVYGSEFEEYADSLAEKLVGLGVEGVSVKNEEQLSEDIQRYYNLILLGSHDNVFISELNNAHKRLGFYTYFQEGKLVVLDAEGKVTSEYGASTGLIQATQNIWNPKGIGAGENVVWMISGTDADGVKNAAKFLVNSHKDLRYAYAAVITEGKIVKVP